MQRYRYLLVLLFFCIDSAYSADLLQLYNESQRYDPLLAGVRSTQKAAQEKRVQGNASLKPSLSLNAGWNENLGHQTYYVPSEISQHLGYQQWNSALNLTYPIYRPGYQFQAQQGDFQAEQGDYQLTLAQQDLIIRVAQAYMDVCIAEEALVVLDQQKSLIEQQLKLAKKSFKIGSATIVDTHEAQARYDLVESQRTASLLDIQNKKVVLEHLVGHPIPNVEHLSSKAKVDVYTIKFATLKEWLDFADRNHPAIKVAEKSENIAHLEYKKSQAALNPTVDLASQLGWNQAQGTDSLATHYKQHLATIGVQVNYPLYSGGGLDSKSRETASLYDKALSDVQSARLSANQNTQQAWNAFQNTKTQLFALEQSVISSASVLKSTKRGQEVGVRTNIDVLNAQQLFAQSQRDALKVRYDMVLSFLRLYAAAGCLDIETLAAINRYFTTR
jgi:outer membrane protein